jgi:proton glutamate symport protein
MATSNAPSTAPASAPPPRGLKRISQAQWIVISMVVGILLGVLFPDLPAGQKGFQASDLRVLATIFLRMIKSLIVPLLFATLVVGIAGHGDDMKRVGKLAFRSIVYFELVTTLALVVGLLAVNIVKPGVGVNLAAASAEAGAELAK